MNLLTLVLIAIAVFGLPTLYFAWRSREFRKFLAGAFFVSAGIQLNPTPKQTSVTDPSVSIRSCLAFSICARERY
jgi:hypothetical protein